MNRLIQATLLRLLRAAGDEPLGEATLKAALRSSFPSERFTEADLNAHLRIAESREWIAGASDPISDTVWALTAKGKIQAAKL